MDGLPGRDTQALHFGTDGWRGVIGADFTLYRAAAVAGAVAGYLRQSAPGRPCIVGYDNRFLAEAFALVATLTLEAAGVSARVCRAPVPTPTLALAVRQRGAGGGLMLTASHNPPAYQGIKFIAGYGGPATPAVAAEIEERARALLADPPSYLAAAVAEARAWTAGAPGGAPPPRAALDPAPPYLAHLATLADLDAVRTAPVRYAIDAMHGTGAPYLERLFPTRAWRRLRLARDPFFGGTTPEPTAPHLKELIRLVRQGMADLGLATDGDADRFGVADSQGGYLPPNQVLPLLLWYLYRHRGLKGDVARTVATTHLLDRIAAGAGASVHETPVGFKYLCQEMLQRDVLLAGEESGGLSLRGHVPAKDGLLACLLLAELRARLGRPLASLLAEIHREYGPAVSGRLDLPLGDGPAHSIADGQAAGEGDNQAELAAARLAESPPPSLGGLPVQAVRRDAGVKLLLAGGAWVLFRPSGTEPVLRIYAEAADPARVEAILTAARRAVAPAAART